MRWYLIWLLMGFFCNLELCQAEDEVQKEKLGRGLVGVVSPEGKVVLSWRLLASDPADVQFHVFMIKDGEYIEMSREVIKDATSWTGEDAREAIDYRLIANSPSKKDFEEITRLNMSSIAEGKGYLSIPLKTLEGYSPNDAAVGDLDGDGEYEIVLHQMGVSRDNSQSGFTSPPIFEAYKLTGELLWRINLGFNIREGAHYNPFLVYDFDGDGKAEFVCRTADGTLDGTGNYIGDPFVDYREQSGQVQGRVLQGLEFLTVFDGLTGKEMKSVPFEPARGKVSDWGDNYGNRCDRFLACVAFLDGKRPSIVVTRGYYAKTMLCAWNWREGKLSKVWTFNSDDGSAANKKFRGQGNHSIAVADIDDDGKDEIIFGSCVIDDDGKGVYSTGYGHGDALHVTDIDPELPGLEVFKANGDTQNAAGLHLRSARTGETLFKLASTGDEGVVRACALDIDPRYPGLEFWGQGQGVSGLYSAKGERIPGKSPRTCNFGIWWDGDLSRELLNGTRITKWDFENQREIPLFDGNQEGCVSVNGTKSNPSLCADILGDWREELIIPTRDRKELRIYVSPLPTDKKIVSLMQDHVYRMSVAWQNSGYNQPAHPGYYLGTK